MPGPLGSGWRRPGAWARERTALPLDLRSVPASTTSLLPPQGLAESPERGLGGRGACGPGAGGGVGGGSAQRRDSQRAGGQDSKGRRGKTGPGRDWAGHGGLRNISVQTGSLGWRGGQGRGGEGPLAGPRREAVGPECLVTPSPARPSGLGRAHGGEVWGGWPRSSAEPWQPLVCGAGSACVWPCQVRSKAGRQPSM